MIITPILRGTENVTVAKLLLSKLHNSMFIPPRLSVINPGMYVIYYETNPHFKEKFQTTTITYYSLGVIESLETAVVRRNDEKKK